MSSSTCLNCGATPHLTDNFCPSCGQKSGTHRLTLAHFFHDFFHAVTHADKGIFHLLKALALRPGIVAREYIAGKRKKYFNPFSLFLILAGVYVISSNMFTHAGKPNEPDSAVLARIPTAAGKRNYTLMVQRGGEINRFMTKNSNILPMFAVPLFSLLTWLFYRRKGYNYAEHLTANVFFVTFSNLVFTVIVFPLQGLWGGSRNSSFFFPMLGLFLQVLYFSWSYYQFLPSANSPRKLLASVGISLLGVLLWAMLTMTVIALYIYRGPSFVNFFTRMFA